MSDPLLDATKALRETTNGEEQANGRYTRSRVLSAVRLQARRRVLNATFGIPLAAILIGSGAWAASGKRLPLFVQRVTVALGWREPPSANMILTPSAKLRARAVAAIPMQDSTSPEAHAASELTFDGIAATPSSHAESPLAPQQDTRVFAKKEATQPRRLVASDAQPLPRDSRLTEQELAAYEFAHRAHFVDKDPSAALAAWSDYLRQHPRGRFVVEATYNRALCLVRLGRNAEAKQALMPIAQGVFGNYRRREAGALIDQLSAD